MLALASFVLGYSTPLSIAPGCYEGSVPFIIDNKVTLKSDGTADLDINVLIAHQEIVCNAEAATIADTVTFPNSGTTGDCLGDNLRDQGKDPSKYYLTDNGDGTLTFLSDGYPPLSMSACTSEKKASPLSPEWQEVVDWRAALVKTGEIKAAAPTGCYEGSVPFIIDNKITFNADGTSDLDINVLIAHQDVVCKAETTTVTSSQVTFPNSGTTGDCLGDNLRDQGKDPSKYILEVNSDGTLTFLSDGYPPLTMTSGC